MTDRERVARAAYRILDEGDSDPWDAVVERRQRMGAEVTSPTMECALKLADAALAAMPTWRRIPDEVREGEAPFDGTNYPIAQWDGHRWTRNWCAAWRYAGPRAGWRWQSGGLAVPFKPTHYHPLAPLPAPPAGEVGVVAIGYANTATGGVEIDNAGIIRRAPGAGEVG